MINASDHQINANSTSPLEEYLRIIIGNCIATFTLIFNLFNIIVIISKKQLQTITNIIMASMFLADVLFAVAYLYPYLGNPSFGEQNWLYCNISSNIPITVIIAINLHLVAVSIDKLIAVEAPIRYHIFSKSRYVYILVIFIWIVSILIGFMPIMSFRPLVSNQCYIWDPSNIHEIRYSLMQIILFFILPFVIMTIIYVRIFYIAKSVTLRQHAIQSLCLHSSVLNPPQRFRKHLKAAKVLAIIISTYFIMWTPFYIDSLISILNSRPEAKEDLSIEVLKTVFIYVTNCYPAINAILYGYLVNDIRNTVFNLIKLRRHKVSPLSKSIRTPNLQFITVRER